MDDAFGNWLAGFIDGEGSFLIAPVNRGGYRPSFGIALRSDDAAILHRIERETGIGCVYSGKSGRVAIWDVTTKGGCIALVELLDHYALQAKKARDYVIWREAVVAWANMKLGHPGTWGQTPYDWSKIEQLRDKLMQGRRYEAADPPRAA